MKRKQPAQDGNVVEKGTPRRLSGLRIAGYSLVVGLTGALPLLLYAAFGPADGNPIGLGLLAMVTVPPAEIGIVAGLVVEVVQRLRARKPRPASGRSSRFTRAWPWRC